MAWGCDSWMTQLFWQLKSCRAIVKRQYPSLLFIRLRSPPPFFRIPEMKSCWKESRAHVPRA